MLKHSAPSWGPPRSASNMSPSRWATRSLIPASATISRPIAALPGRSTIVELSSGWRRQSAIENSPWPPATSSSDRGSDASATAFATSSLDSRASWYWPRM